MKHNNKHGRGSSNAIWARRQLRSGQHMIIDRDELLVGQKTEKKGTKYNSLTQARKVVQSGQAIVRIADGVVVSVK